MMFFEALSLETLIPSSAGFLNRKFKTEILNRNFVLSDRNFDWLLHLYPFILYRSLFWTEILHAERAAFPVHASCQQLQVEIN